MSVEPVEGELVEEPAQSLAVVQAAPQQLAVAVTADDLVERLALIQDAADRAMIADVDYGKIPGAQKPSLFKPGAEKLAALFRLDVQISHEQLWGPGDHLTVTAHAVIYSAIDGMRLGSGEGMCTTREKKYGKRRADRVCPECGKPAIIKGKAEYGGGWVCFKKKDGCGAKWPDGAEVIESQETGEIENSDLPDTWNTVIKMARKRALVDAVLLVTGASAIFTQDVEDQPRSSEQLSGMEAHAPGAGDAQQQRPAPQASAQTSERAASAGQRKKINAKASEAHLSSIALANVLLIATGNEERDWEAGKESHEAAEAAAQGWLKRAMDRLPMAKVDAVLEGIEKGKKA